LFPPKTFEMVYLTHKWKKGHKYLYLEKKARIEGKVKRVFQIYLGPEDKIEEHHIMLNIDKLQTRTYDMGSAVLYDMAEELGLRDVINRHTDKKRNQGFSVGEYLVIAIINRCLRPCSKNTLREWLEGDYLGILYKDAINQISSQAYWNHFQYFSTDLLQQIQREITATVLDLFDVELDCILYDPTNFITHGGHHDDDHLAQFGNSKEKRYDKRIVNLSLLCSKTDAIPLWHQTYAGNIHDANHFTSAIKSITDFMEFLNYDLKDLTLIFDKGNHSEEIIRYIRESNLNIITSIRKSSHKQKVQEPTSKFNFITLRNGKKVGYMTYQTKFHGSNGNLLIIYDRQVRKRSLAIFARKLRRRRQAINKFLQERLNDHKWREKKNVDKKLRGLCKGYPFRKIFQYEVSGEYAELEVSISESVEAKAIYCRQLGRSAMFSTQKTWSAKTVIQHYRDKYSIEDSFKQMKNHSSIALKPMYHHANLSIHVHVFTCVMAYLLTTLVKKKLQDNGVEMTTRALQKNLDKLQLTEVGKGQLKQPLLQLNAVSEEVKKLARVFDLDTKIENLGE